MLSLSTLHRFLTILPSFKKNAVTGVNTSSHAFENESGFILVSTLIILILLVMLGISTTTNTNIELKIAGNDKIYKQNFYMVEGGSYVEAGKVGVSASPYQVSDPGKSDQILTVIPNPAQFKASDSTTWPATVFKPLSYKSLVTYLYADTPPKGYDASQFSSYKFRIDGAPNVTNGNVVIELGGSKIGVKVSM